MGRIGEAVSRRGRTERLIKHGLTFAELIEALHANNQNVGGGQVVRSGESLLVHGVGLATDPAQIGNIVITAHDGAPHEYATWRRCRWITRFVVVR